jgi:thiol-disulfide isomerase/thioredoxin
MLVAAVAAVALVGSASAQYGQTKLEVGSDAPKLSIQEWVKGDKVEEFKEGHVYVVEFWATWCGPCKASIPHLTELQEHYKNNVTIIGISDETPDKVKPFVTDWGKKMEYTVAIDQNNQTNSAWRQAAGINYIPFAFIVDGNKKIAWMGNPADPDSGLDTVLGKVAKGRYDPKLEEAAAPLIEQLDWSVTMRDWQAFENYTAQVLTMSPRIFNDVAIKKFRVLLLEKGDVQAAIDYALGDFAAMYADDIETLFTLAELILTDSTILRAAPDQLKPVALELADLAAASGQDPEALRVLAMALYQNGEVEEAIETQRRAYFMVEPERKVEFKRLLDQYQNRSAAQQAGR